MLLASLMLESLIAMQRGKSVIDDIICSYLCELSQLEKYAVILKAFFLDLTIENGQNYQIMNMNLKPTF